MSPTETTDVRRCADCGDTEEDSNLTRCHGCGKTICIDNCRAAWDDEHGVDFCHECVEAERLRPTWMVLRPSVYDDEDDGRSYVVAHWEDVAAELDLQRRVHAGPVDWYRAISIVESATESAPTPDPGAAP